MSIVYTLVTRNNRPEGTTHFSAVAIPVGITRLHFNIDRSDLKDPKIAVAGQLFLSQDGGDSWRPWGGVGTIGDGVEPAGFGVDIPEPTNPNRMAKGTVTQTSNGRIALEIEAFTEAEINQ